MIDKNKYLEKYEWDFKGRHIEVYHTNRTIPVLVCIDGNEYGYAEFDKGFEPKLTYEIKWEDLKLTLVFKKSRFTLYENGQPVTQDTGKSSFTNGFRLELKLFFGLFALIPLLYPLIASVPWFFKLIAIVVGIISIVLLVLIFRSQKLSSTKQTVFSFLVSLSGIVVFLITFIANYRG